MTKKIVKATVTADFSFLLNGAGWIKKNQSVFKQGCIVLANEEGIQPSAKEQLLAASVAKAGKSNTGLSESGWNGLALVIGACSPKSTKTLPAEKPEKMQKFLFKDVTTPELKGTGNTRAVLTGEQLLEAGITRQFLKVGERKEAANAAAEERNKIIAANQAAYEEKKTARLAARGKKPEVIPADKKEEGLL